MKLSLLAVVLTVAWLDYGRAKRVMLLDSTKSNNLGWPIYSERGQHDEDGWQEETYNGDSKLRSYVTCDVTRHDVKNWLRTPFIPVGDANQVWIELLFTIRNCQNYPRKQLRSCKETFQLMKYEAEYDFASESGDLPAWKEDSFTFIDRIAADDAGDGADKETEVREVVVTKKGLYVVLLDEGACTSLISLKVFAEVCPETVINMAVFPERPTVTKAQSFERVEGKCVANANSTKPGAPVMLCKTDGAWDDTLGHSACACNPGYTADGDRCVECNPGSYKSTHSNDDSCRLCPIHSRSNSLAAAECTCLPGYYRADTDLPSDACTQPPSRPQHITYDVLSSDSVRLSWSAPERSGGREDVRYRVECDECRHGLMQPIKDTFVTLLRLSPTVQYNIRVIAENGVSHMEKESVQRRTGEIGVRIEGQSSNTIVPRYPVRNLRVGQDGQTVSATWDPPMIQNRNATVRQYMIRYRQRDHTTGVIHAPTQTFSDAAPFRIHAAHSRNMEYGFEVRAELPNSGWGTWSPIVWSAAQQLGQTTQAPMNTALAIALVVAVIVFGAIIALMWWLRKRHPHGSEATDSTAIKSASSPLMPALYSSSGTYKPYYVDPSTYEDPFLAVQDFATEIERTRVRSVSVIGSGEFGEVCRGTLLTSSGAEQCVAIKVLKQGSSDKAKTDFLAEASIMGQFNHPNVISLRGVITTSDPVMIVTEYMENGSLDAFVRRQSSTLVPVQMTHMLRGIACGMKYLSDMGFVHRDLAARNVLVGAQLLCKISDFGLSRETDGSTEQVYTTRGGKIPVRWTAPEAIGYRKFTSASDVWSFGVVMWEVFNFGERPYGEWSNQQVIHSIEQGYRLPPIYDTPQVILDLMLQCWQRERQFRPTFTKLAHTLEEFNRCPDVYAQLACAPLCNAQSCAFDRCYTTPSSSTLPRLPPRTYPTTYGYHANPPAYHHNDSHHPYHHTADSPPSISNTTASTSASTEQIYATCGGGAGAQMEAVDDVVTFLRCSNLAHLSPAFSDIPDVDALIHSCVRDSAFLPSRVQSDADRERLLDVLSQTQRRRTNVKIVPPPVVPGCSGPWV